MHDLDWQGCWNARDLGGLATLRGGVTRSCQLVRSDALDELTEAGWGEVEDYGIRTVIDLRSPEQIPRGRASAPPTIAVRRIPLEAGLLSDPAFADLVRSGAWATSIYLATFLRHWHERVAKVLEEIATSKEGGVLVHCRKGSDRTGVVVLALLAIAEVDPSAIVADYEHTAVRLRTRGAALGVPDDASELGRVYQRLGATPRSGVLEALEAWRSVEARIHPARIATLRARIAGADCA